MLYLAEFTGSLGNARNTRSMAEKLSRPGHVPEKLVCVGYRQNSSDTWAPPSYFFLAFIEGKMNKRIRKEWKHFIYQIVTTENLKNRSQIVNHIGGKKEPLWI